MTDAELKLYITTVEWGTPGNPVSFPNAPTGVITAFASNPLYLWNDKGGVLDSVPARSVSITVFEMWIQDENLGTSDGSPSQTFSTSLSPVRDDSDATEIVLKVDTEVWARVTSLVGQLASAKVYTINPTTGLVTFGDGVNGAIPGNTKVIYLTYMPDTAAYGKDIFEGNWLEVKSNGVTTNAVSVVDEQQISSTTTYVAVANTLMTAVTGVWLQTDTGHTGTNYYTGGSFVGSTGVITLGTPLPGANTAVLVNYTYVPIDDFESVYTPIGLNTVHSFTNPIPQNNAKLIFLRLNVPALATPSGMSNVYFRLLVTYSQ